MNRGGQSLSVGEGNSATVNPIWFLLRYNRRAGLALSVVVFQNLVRGVQPLP